MRRLPPWLLSDETSAPFTHCVQCQLPLLEIDSHWLVTKNYLREECVLEYALCQPCRGDSLAFSEESKAAVRRHLESRIDLAARLAEFMMDPSLDIRVSSCAACRKPRSAMGGHCISALFDPSGDLVEGPLPLLICDGCTEEITSLLSEESLAIWRAFLSRNFEGPPDTAEDWPNPGYPGLL
jgi:hypothetical protein